MKTCMIVNPNAGSSEQFNALHDVLNAHEVVCWETAEAGDGIRMARQALDEGFTRVVAGGGDGTVHEVVNGVVGHEGLEAFGVVPLGTGNDLARTLALPSDPVEALRTVLSGEVRHFDVIYVESPGLDAPRYAINAAAGGFSGEVDGQMNDGMKDRWGPMAYLFGALNALPDMTDYDTHIVYDNGPDEVIEAINIIVANGRTVAGGKQVAPLANPEDGLLDIVIVKAATMLQLTGVTRRLLAGSYLDSPHVLLRHAKRLHVASRPGMWFNVDGELLTDQSITFTVEEGRLPIVVGAEYLAVPDEAYAPRLRRDV